MKWAKASQIDLPIFAIIAVFLSYECHSMIYFMEIEIIFRVQKVLYNPVDFIHLKLTTAVFIEGNFWDSMIDTKWYYLMEQWLTINNIYLFIVQSYIDRNLVSEYDTLKEEQNI